MNIENQFNLIAAEYDRLPDGGLFINHDQFCAEQPEMSHWFDTYWENHIANSELTDKDKELWKERRKLDKECSVEKEVIMLKSADIRLLPASTPIKNFP